MSNICHSEDNKFVGITMYSPNYYKKAARLVRSCERVGVCCKATLLPPNAFGPDAPEGSEKFRFETISMKPSFILSQVRVRVRVRVRIRVRVRGWGSDRLLVVVLRLVPLARGLRQGAKLQEGVALAVPVS